MQQSLLPPPPAPREMQDFDLNYPDAELILGLVYAVGTDYAPVLSFLNDRLRLSNYHPEEIRLSKHFRETADRLQIELPAAGVGVYGETDAKIRAGNALREQTERADICALIGASKIYSSRNQGPEGNPEAHRRTAHLIVSLKRPEEVETLRRLYGTGFYLIGIFAGESERRKYLTERKGLTSKEADDLIERDQKESGDFGQRTRDTFQMADVFVDVDKGRYERGLERFLGLVFGNPFETPTKDEHAMFLAYAASLRSGDLARQVGAALTCSQGEVVALGCNDVPAPGGGLYWSDGPRDERDWKQGYDANDRVQEQIVNDVFARLRDYINLGNNPKATEITVKAILSGDSKISQIAEFGRSVHAEMDALMAAGRTGVIFRDATLYTTTFPCHTCTRHIITAGLKRVVYIEPYPKSRAPELHSDAIYIKGEDHEAGWNPGDRIPFEPFLGIGPRRFFDLFSLKLSAGYSVERKMEDGQKKGWDIRADSHPRVPMPPNSYLEREELISTTLNGIRRKDDANRSGDQQTDTGQERPGVLGIAREDSSQSRKLA